MKIKLIAISKTTAAYLKDGMDIYLERLKHYAPFEYIEIPDIKNTKKLSEPAIQIEEGKKILAQLSIADHVVLLDEKGKSYSSVSFSKFLEKKSMSGVRNLIFIIGGPYGFSEEIKTRANGKISLSEMTFSHQMVRLFFLEQLYRAQSITKGEPYHHA